MIGTIFVAILFMIVLSVLCSGDGESANTSTKRNVDAQKRTANNYYGGCSCYECPSCGAPGFDGFCEECGYPDINQGWLGENY